MPHAAVLDVATSLPPRRDAAQPDSAAWFVAVLLGRAGVTAAFAFWLLTRHPGWTDIFRGGAYYGLADGGLGLIMATLLVRHRPIAAPPLLVALTLVDAFMRIAAGLAVLQFPGIPYFPITVVLLFCALGVWAATAGLTAMVAWYVAHERHRHAVGGKPSRVHAIFDPLSVTGVIALVAAVSAFIAGPPATAASLRFVAGITSSALALAFLGGAVGAAWRRA